MKLYVVQSKMSPDSGWIPLSNFNGVVAHSCKFDAMDTAKEFKRMFQELDVRVVEVEQTATEVYI